jgi:hypothetical protein
MAVEVPVMLGALEFRGVEGEESTLTTLDQNFELRIHGRLVWMMLCQHPSQCTDKYDDHYAGTYGCSNEDLLPSDRVPHGTTSLRF